MLEHIFAFFQRNGIDDALALQAAQARFQHAPLAGVQHHRHAGDIRLAGHQVQKAHHRHFGIEHRLVHVHVDDLRAVFHLLARHGQRLFVLLGQDKPRKRLGAADVGALAHVHEQRVFINYQRLKARQAQRRDGRFWGVGGSGRSRHGIH